jgi:hypothetical protein
LAAAAAVYGFTYAAVYVFLWMPMVDGVTLGWDMLTTYWGDVAYQARWVGAGELPLWNPYERLGYPAYADPQPGQFYPVNWLLYPLAWGFDWMPYWGILLKNWLHLVLASVGMFALLRQRNEVPAACWAGGYLYAFAAPVMEWTASALLWPSCWMPWLWLALDRLLRRPTWRGGLVTGVIGAMPILAGNPPALWYGLLGTLAFAGFVAVEQLRRQGERLRYALRSFRALVVSVAVALCIGSPALLPVQELYAHSVRTNRSWSFVLSTNLTVDRLWGFIFPDLAPRSYFYFGLISLFLAALALYRAPRRVGWAVGLTVFGVLLAIGGHGFVLRPLAEIIPPFGFFRGPHRYSILCSTGMAFWAPVGISVLARMPSRKRRRGGLVLTIISTIGVIAGIVLMSDVYSGAQVVPKIRVNPTLFFGILLSAVSLLAGGLLWLRSDFAKRIWPAAFVVVVALSLWLGGWTRITRANIFPRPTLSRDSLLPLARVDRDNQRIYDDRFLLYRPGSRLSLRDAGGYEGDPLGSTRYHELMQRVHREPALMRHLGVALYMRGTPPPLSPRVRGALRLSEFRPLENRGMYGVQGPAPLVYVVPRVDFVATPEQALERWLTGPVGQTAVVARTDARATEELVALATTTETEAYVGRLSPRGPDRLIAHVESPRGGMAVVLEAWYPGWEAQVDGRPAEIYRVNYLFRGVVVGPGAHIVSMQFKPWRFYASAMLFVGGLLIALGLQSNRIRRRLRLS